MAEASEAEISEAAIAVHWKEEPLIQPPPSFVAQANMNDKAILERFAEKNFPECFREYAELLSWDRPWDVTLDTSNPPFWKWFVGGKLNAAYNCVDRHLAKYGNKAAMVWVPEPEDEPPRVITYRELHMMVNEFALVLKEFAGLATGDRVTFHLPMIPELPISMLASARLGLIHNQVFGGFSARACAERIKDSGSRVLVTCDGYYRNGNLIDKKRDADITVEEARQLGIEVDKVLVWRRRPGRYVSKAKMVEGRDFFVDDVLKPYRGETVDPVSMDSEAPLFIMYTSGSTGRPKGAQHGTGGYLAYVAGTSKYVQDIHPEDVYWCFADIGWITGHSYIVYGPLAVAATSVMYEGVPLCPDAGRPWRIAERLSVNIFHTAPTTIRMLRKAGPGEPWKYNYHFKAMTTVGEPIEPETWHWYYETVGKGEAVITDTWWQT
jgi:acetyl-CoA synthetase